MYSGGKIIQEVHWPKRMGLECSLLALKEPIKELYILSYI